jgi:hypothetical protein
MLHAATGTAAAPAIAPAIATSPSRTAGIARTTATTAAEPPPGLRHSLSGAYGNLRFCS